MDTYWLEKEVLLLAVLKIRSDSENRRLIEITDAPLDWGWIGGQLLHHRLTGYFYYGLGELRKRILFGEFHKNMELIVKAQKQQTLEINQLILPILHDMDAAGIRYAALKGLVFNSSIYEIGERRSNDSDILVLEDDLDLLDKLLRSHGYIQTLMRNGEYKEASRKEKMIQRMNYHDLVPYVKEVKSPFVSYHEIDVNFHLDSKDNDITREVFMLGTQEYAGEYVVKGLPWETHMAQLCIHFYREASSSIWSSGRRDVVLYKVVDIVNTIRQVRDHQKLSDWVSIMKRLHLEKACYFTLYHVEQFYPGIIPEQIQSELRPRDTAYLNEIAVSGEDIIIRRQMTFMDEAFHLTYKK